MKFWTRRPGRTRRNAATVAVLLAAVVLAGAAAIPASASIPVNASARGWSVTPSPNPAIPTGQLFWVSCPAANSCTAVGTYTKASGAGVTLAERWDGSSWRVQPIPSPPGAAWSVLLGVSCASLSACEAVGVTTSKAGAQKVLAEGWNGTRWQLQSAPGLAGGNQLNGVSCTSPSACTAVGGTSLAKTLVERWNGSRWQIQSAPTPPGGGFLSGVACTSSTACTAVGGSNPFTPSAKTLAERWNGTTWRIQPTANPPQGGGALFSVACTSPSACTAVGNSNAGNLAERWNGTSWSIQHTPNPAGAQFTFLNVVACTSASSCIAAGAYQDSSGAFQGLAERWNGSSWAIQPTPRLPGGVMSELIGVACTSGTSCLAVGYSSPNLFNNQSPATLAERWDGSAWRVQRTPSPLGAAASNLNAASCVSRSACVAVGNTSNSRGTPLTLAQRWNGHTWSTQPTPSPANGGNLIGVSCPSRSSCLAVGGHGNPNVEVPSGTLAEQWNGRGWRIQPTPNPRGGGWFLIAVSCTSPSACTAVGGSIEPPGKPQGGTLAERWNGHTWSIQPTPNPPGHGVKLLNSVACTSRSSCMAVGNEFDPATGESLGTLAERWNGRTWRIVPTFKPAPHGPNAGLNGVACTSASACTAVGNQTLVKTLAERWNGRRWQVQATPNPSGGQNIFLAGVACPARTVCTAFGLNLTSSGPFTLAERWSGGRWRIQPTPFLNAYDIGFPGVACPTVSACYAVASYTNNGPSLTLVEPWNGTGTGTQAADGLPVAPNALSPAGFRARMPGSLPISGATPAGAWSRFRVGNFLRVTPPGR